MTDHGILAGPERPGKAGILSGGPEISESLRFEERLISDDYGYAFGICAADIDGDGHVDIVSADAHRGLYWYANDGSGGFTRYVVNRGQRMRLERMACADLTGNGLPDIVVVDNIHGDVLLFENPGDPRRGEAWPSQYIAGPATDISRIPLVGALPHAYDVCLADLDGDGELEVAASSWIGGDFAWFDRRDGAWHKHLIGHVAGEARTIRAADFDGDGYMDLLATAPSEGEVICFRNPGAPADSPWTKHVIARELRPVHGHAVDMTGNGRPDVVMALGMGDASADVAAHGVVWFENPGGFDVPWPRHVIADGLPRAFEAVAVDLDGDGDIEVVATGWGRSGQVVLLKHGGDPRGPWGKQVIKDNWTNANQVIVADLDGDGRPDIVACAERGSNELRWWRNLG